MILALDVSTSCTGVAIQAYDGTLIATEAIDLRKIENIFDKAEEVKKVIKRLHSAYRFTNIFIEEPLSVMGRGMSTAHVLFLLSKFNGIVSWLCYDTIGIQPRYLKAMSARKSIGIKVEKGQNAKEVVFKFLLDTEPRFTVEYTPKGNPKHGTLDRADAVVIAKAGLLECQKQQS
jgi:hypothetical protein